MCLNEETTSLAIIILDEAEAQEQLHGVGGKGGSLYRCTGKSLSLAVNLNCVRYTEGGEHQFDVCMALHLAWMPQVGTGPSETFFWASSNGRPAKNIYTEL